MLTAVGEHELLLFWIQLVLLLGTARALGLIVQRFGQPRVVGELSAGVLLGPSVFGRLLPDVAAWVFPGGAVQSAMILAIAWMGVLLLLVVTGFETDLNLLGRLGKPVVGLSVGSLIVPLAFGVGLGWLMPEFLWGPEASRIGFALFIGVALSISALPVIAKILADMGLMRRNVGQLTIAAAMINDLVGWMLLGVVVGVFTVGSVSITAIGMTTVSVVAFLVLGLTVGQRFADAVLRRARGAGGFASALSATLFVAFAFGAVTQALGVEAVLGALVAGVILGRSRYQRLDVRRSIEVLSSSIFAPIFFATAGLYVDLAVLFEPEAAFWLAIVLVVATAAKIVGSFLGGAVSGMSRLESLAAGLGLNARGAMEIVLATIGLALGALNDVSYAIIVVMAVATSMAAPPLMRPVLARMRANPVEAERLAHEALLDAAIVAGARSALLPTRGGLNSAVAARVLDALLQPATPVTVLTVGSVDRDREDFAGIDVALADRTVEHRHVPTGDPADRILEEASLGHRLITLGLNDDFSGSHRLSDAIQRVIAESPIPILLVRRGVHVRDAADLEQSAFRRVLLGVTGTQEGRAAEEVAFRLSTRYSADVRAVHVVTRGAAKEVASPSVGRQLRRVRAVAASFTATVDVEARHATSAADELIRVATDWQADTIVIGATIRPFEGTPFLGHGTEWLFEHARQTVIGVVFPLTDEE